MTDSTFERRRVPLDEGHLSFLYRSGPGPALVLIPGSYSAASQWDGVVALLDKNLALLLVELRGHGDSWPPPTDGSIEQFALDVLAAVDSLDVGPFYIGGHSIGGMVALEAARVREHRVKGVLCCEGWTNYHAESDAFGGKTTNPMTPEQQAQVEQARETVTRRWTDEQVKAFGRIWRQWDGYDFLCSTDIPILEVYGDRGRPIPSREALKIPDRPNIVLHWIPGAGHASLPIVRPRDIAAAFSSFIRQVESAG